MVNNNNLPVKTEFHYQYSPPPRNEGSGLLRSTLMVLFRQKRCILWFLIISFVSVAVFTFVSPSIYQSEAKIFVKLGRENMSLDPSVVGPAAAVRPERQSELNSEVAALKSRLIAEQTVDSLGPRTVLNASENESTKDSASQQGGYLKSLMVKIGLKKAVPMKEVAANKLMKNLAVWAEDESHIIALRYEAESPSLAQDVLNVVIGQYHDQHIAMHQSQAPLQFVEKKAEGLRSSLEQKEILLKDFQAQNSISSMEAQKTEILGQISLLQAEIDQVFSQIGASRAKIVSIQSSLQGRSPNRELNRVVGRPNRAVEVIKERLFDLRSQEADLAALYPDTDRGLIDLREKIRLAEEQLNNESAARAEITEGIDTNYQALELSLANEQAQLQALNAREAILSRQLKERNASLLDLSSKETRLVGLQREVEIASGEYQQYRENLQRAKVSAELDSSRISNLSIIQPPSFSHIPIKPRKVLNLLLGLLFGLTGGVALAFLREYFDSTLKTTEDIEEKLGLPVLAVISEEDLEKCI